MDKSSSWKNNILYGIIFSFSIILPEKVLGIFFLENQVVFDWFFWLTMFAVGFLISLSRARLWVLALLGLFFVMELIQLSHGVYFGKPIFPTDIGRILLENREVFLSIEANFFDALIIFIVLSTFFFIMIWSYLFFYTHSKKCSYIILLVFLLLGTKLHRAYKRPLKFFHPVATRNSFHNSLNSFSFYFVKGIFGKKNNVGKEYIPYEVKSLKEIPEIDNIILIFGESLTANNFSFYGYKRNTTPFITQISTNEERFLKKDAYSSAVSSLVATPIFFNAIRERNNIKQLKSKQSNLFRLAKSRGFKTFFFSSHSSTNLFEIGARYIDEVQSYESTNKLLFKLKHDDFLLGYFEKIHNKTKNFIVLNPFTNHAPYKGNYKPEQAKFLVKETMSRREKVNSEYDNGLIAFDLWLENIIKLAKKNFTGRTYIIVTSDHGQLLGKNGKFGHNHLNLDCAKIPFFIYNLNDSKQDKWWKEWEKEKVVNHYIIAKKIMNLLGYQLKNPNEKLNEYYLLGTNLFEENFLRYNLEKGILVD